MSQKRRIFVLSGSMFLALLILAVGGRLYLHSDVPLKGFVYLYVGAALSMLIAVVGKAILTWHLTRSVTWQTEAMDTIITWM